MKIRPLTNLISGLTGYSADAQSSQQSAGNQQTQRATQANEDAASVKVASQNKSSATDRAAYVASLKEQVQNGTYKPSSEKVAEALYNDLF